MSIPPIRHPREKYLNLSDAQRAALKEVMDGFGDARPSFKEYDAAERKLLAIPTDKAPRGTTRRGRFPNTRPGFDIADVKLTSAFVAQRDLPSGIGLFPRYDSGSNFGVGNAADIAWTNIWNGWGQKKPDLEIQIEEVEEMLSPEASRATERTQEQGI